MSISNLFSTNDYTIYCQKFFSNKHSSFDSLSIFELTDGSPANLPDNFWSFAYFSNNLSAVKSITLPSIAALVTSLGGETKVSNGQYFDLWIVNKTAHNINLIYPAGYRFLYVTNSTGSETIVLPNTASRLRFMIVKDSDPVVISCDVID